MSQPTSQSQQEESDDLATLVEALAHVSRIVLFCFMKDDISLKDNIASNFLARSTGMLESIYMLWKQNNESDAWILQRCQLERFFLLRHLHNSNQFESFSDFTFITLHEARNKLLSSTDPEVRSRYERQIRPLQKKNRLKYEDIMAKGKRWSRPNNEELAKKMDAQFLYDVGYDYASRHVHPMATDGAEFLKRLDHLNSEAPKLDDTVVRNSILTQSMILQECMSISDFGWENILFDFVDEVRKFFQGDMSSYGVTLLKIIAAGPDFELCSSESKS